MSANDSIDQSVTAAARRSARAPSARPITRTDGDLDSPVATRRHLDARAIGLVFCLCLIWGIQQVVMKGVSLDVAPVMQLAIRFAAASLFFGVWVLARDGRRAFSDGTLASGLLLGALFSLEFVLIGQALLHTTAAHTTVFLYSAPIFTALGMQYLPEERLSRIQWIGIVAAFAGIAVAFLGADGRPVADLVVGDSLALLAGVAWGSANVVLRRGRIGSATTSKTVLYQVGPAAVILLAFAAATRQVGVVPSMAAIFSLLFQTFVISIVSYLVWFWLIRHYLTSRLMLLTLLTPLFGVVFGALILHDAIAPRFATGAALVLAGILVVNGQRALQRFI